MPKYLVKVCYMAEGAKGLLKDGGSKRRDVAKKLVEGVGGKFESMYFAFGDTDAYLIADLPDAASATAVSLTVGASGAVKCTTTPLITPEEVDQASKKKIQYKAPGE